MKSKDADAAGAETSGADPTVPPKGGLADAAQYLGWFSIALGLSEALFPHATGRAIGMPGRSTLARIYGVREIGAGVGLLTAKDPTPFLWGRVAGDVMDIATLASQLINGRSGVRSIFGKSSRRKTALALGFVAGVTALDIAIAQAATAARNLAAPFDDGDGAGMHDSAEKMRGVAPDTGFDKPADLQTPQASPPYAAS